MEKNIAYIALFAALIAVLGLIPKITLAFGVPITAQSLGVMLCGTVLGARRGALAVGLFLLLVALGLPLLAGGRGGLGVFASPTVGFLVGFPVAAFVTGWITERWRSAPVGIAAGVAAVIGGINTDQNQSKHHQRGHAPAVDPPQHRQQQHDGGETGDNPDPVGCKEFGDSSCLVSKPDKDERGDNGDQP